jgi:hypothetical protein
VLATLPYLPPPPTTPPRPQPRSLPRNPLCLSAFPYSPPSLRPRPEKTRVRGALLQTCLGVLMLEEKETALKEEEEEALIMLPLFRLSCIFI